VQESAAAADTRDMDSSFAMALDVLPPAPWDVRAIRADGGPVGLRLLGAREGRLHCTLDAVDIETGLSLTIPVESPERGGFSVECAVEEVVPLGASRLAADLRVVEVARRKPFRVDARDEARTPAVLWVLEAVNHGVGTELTGWAVDVSPGGIGFMVTALLQPGDRLLVQTRYDGIGIQGEVEVTGVDRGAEGGWRAGCRFVDLADETRAQLDARAGRAA
jgi:PilZ domain